MTSEIRQAFEHPEARAAATADGTRDRLSLRDHIREVEIGAFETERGHAQRLRFNIVVEVAPPEAPLGDDVDRILSYDNLTGAIAAELAAERLNLLETLAERIAARILVKRRALRVFVRIEKLDRGPGALGVEIMRARAEETPAPRHAPGPAPGAAPAVVAVSAAAAGHPGLGRWLDTLIAEAAPAVVCVAAAGGALPATAAPEARRQIALLALDQAAWALAGRDARLLPAASRTELDWAIAAGRVAVWAPARLVRDAAERLDETDPGALAAWLAARLGAARLTVVGMVPPPGWQGALTRLGTDFAAPA